jgi:hypothetical protein
MDKRMHHRCTALSNGHPHNTPFGAFISREQITDYVTQATATPRKNQEGSCPKDRAEQGP